jgi:hypothetical protein
MLTKKLWIFTRIYKYVQCQFFTDMLLFIYIRSTSNMYWFIGMQILCQWIPTNSYLVTFNYYIRSAIRWAITKVIFNYSHLPKAKYASIVKNLFGFFSFYFQLQGDWQVLQTSTHPSQQFSTSFKAANSRQVQTSNIPFVGNTKKLPYKNWFTPVLEKWEFSWPWFIMCHFEDEHRTSAHHFYNDAKLWGFRQLWELISLSH